jgi:hypothetical protein
MQVALGLDKRVADEDELTVARMLFNTAAGCAPLASEDILYNWWCAHAEDGAEPGPSGAWAWRRFVALRSRELRSGDPTGSGRITAVGVFRLSHCCSMAELPLTYVMHAHRAYAPSPRHRSCPPPPPPPPLLPEWRLQSDRAAGFCALRARGTARWIGSVM